MSSRAIAYPASGLWEVSTARHVRGRLPKLGCTRSDPSELAEAPDSDPLVAAAGRLCSPFRGLSRPIVGGSVRQRKQSCGLILVFAEVGSGRLCSGWNTSGSP